MTREPLAVALSIAGSDSGGGAGIQADLATFAAAGVFGTCVVTALTAQNLAGVAGVALAEPAFVARQLEAVLAGFEVRAIKTGMLGSRAILETVAEILARVNPRALVVDPIQWSGRGTRLLDPDALEACRARLIPLATLVTPNVAELEELSGRPARSVAQAIDAAKMLRDRTGAAVLVKGGHLPGPADDHLVTRDVVIDFPGERIEGVETHGLGCLLSAGVAAGLARGAALVEAVAESKRRVADAFARPIVLGSRTLVLGTGPAYRAAGEATTPAEVAPLEAEATAR